VLFPTLLSDRLPFFVEIIIIFVQNPDQKSQST